MKVLIVEPGKPARKAEIDNNLKAMQETVGGYIETVTPFREDVVLIVNEEGKLKDLPLCRTLVRREWTRMGPIMGTFIVCGIDWDEGEFRGLSDKQANALKHKFDWPTVLVD